MHDVAWHCHANIVCSMYGCAETISANILKSSYVCHSRKETFRIVDSTWTQFKGGCCDTGYSWKWKENLIFWQHGARQPGLLSILSLRLCDFSSLAVHIKFKKNHFIPVVTAALLSQFTSKCLTSPFHLHPSSINVQWTIKACTSRRMKLSGKTYNKITDKMCIGKMTKKHALTCKIRLTKIPWFQNFVLM